MAASGFNFTGQVNLALNQGSVRTVAQQVQAGLSGLRATVALDVPPTSLAALGQLNTAAGKLTAAFAALDAQTLKLNTTLYGLANAVKSVLSISTALAAASNATAGAMSQVTSTMTAARAATTSFTTAAERAATRFTAMSIAAGAIVGVGTAFKSSIGEAASFERQMVRVSQVGGNTAVSVSAITQEITRLATTFGTSSRGLAEVATRFQQAGFSLQEMKAGLESVSKADLAPNFGGVEKAGEALVTLRAQFGITADEFESKLGAINSVSSQFAIGANEIVSALKRSGAAFKSAGGSFEEYVALLSSVKTTTQESAESISSSLRTIFSRLQRPAVIESLRQLGVELQYTGKEADALGQKDLKGTFVGPLEAVNRLGDALRGIRSTDTRFASIAEQLGGTRQLEKVIPLLQEQTRAQEILNVAQAGGVQLSDSAAKAQGSLLVQASKVKEEFLALGRAVLNDNGFRAMLDVALKFGSALVFVLDHLKPLIPALTALATIRIGQALAPVASGVGRVLGRGFATGGVVPGVGDSDSVPAVLTPGEFVVRKAAARAIGYDNLHRMNRYAQGGEVKYAQTNVPPPGYVGLFYLDKDIRGRAASNVVVPSAQVGLTDRAFRVIGQTGLPRAEERAAVERAKQDFDSLKAAGQTPQVPQSYLNRYGSVNDKSLKAGFIAQQLDAAVRTRAAAYRRKDYDGVTVPVSSFGIDKATETVAKDAFEKNSIAAIERTAADIFSSLQAVRGLSGGIGANSKNIYDKIVGPQGSGRFFEAAIQLIRGQAVTSSTANFDLPALADANVAKIFRAPLGLYADVKVSDNPESRKSLALKSVREFGLKLTPQGVASRDVDELLAEAAGGRKGRDLTIAESERSFYARLQSPLGGNYTFDPALQGGLKKYFAKEKRYAQGGPVTFEGLFAPGLQVSPEDRSVLREAFDVSARNHRALGSQLEAAGVKGVNTQRLSPFLLLDSALDSNGAHYRGQGLSVVRPNADNLVGTAAHEVLGHGADNHLHRLLTGGPGEGLASASVRTKGSVFSRAADAARTGGLLPQYVASGYQAQYPDDARRLRGEYFAFGVQQAVEDRAQGLPGSLADFGKDPATKKVFSESVLPAVAKASQVDAGPLFRTEAQVKSVVENIRGHLAGNKRVLSLGFARQGFASGGRSTDTVPALLTPGEFVFSRQAAQSIGLGALTHMNRTGKVPGYADGGPVRFTDGGNVRQDEVRYSSLSRTDPAYSQAAAAAEKLGITLTGLTRVVIETRDRMAHFVEFALGAKGSGTSRDLVGDLQFKGRYGGNLKAQSVLPLEERNALIERNVPRLTRVIAGTPFGKSLGDDAQSIVPEIAVQSSRAFDPQRYRNPATKKAFTLEEVQGVLASGPDTELDRVYRNYLLQAIQTKVGRERKKRQDQIASGGAAEYASHLPGRDEDPAVLGAARAEEALATRAFIRSHEERRSRPRVAAQEARRETPAVAPPLQEVAPYNLLPPGVVTPQANAAALAALNPYRVLPGGGGGGRPPSRPAGLAFPDPDDEDLLSALKREVREGRRAGARRVIQEVGQPALERPGYGLAGAGYIANPYNVLPGGNPYVVAPPVETGGVQRPAYGLAPTAVLNPLPLAGSGPYGLAANPAYTPQPYALAGGGRPYRVAPSAAPNPYPLAAEAAAPATYPLQDRDLDAYPLLPAGRRRRDRVDRLAPPPTLQPYALADEVEKREQLRRTYERRQASLDETRAFQANLGFVGPPAPKQSLYSRAAGFAGGVYDRVRGFFGRGPQAAELDPATQAARANRANLAYFGLLTAGSYGSDLINRSAGDAQGAVGGRYESRYTATRGAGGAVQGALVGASVGTVFGPQGIAVGAAAGALYGFTSSLQEATREIREVKIANALEEVSLKLKAFAQGGLETGPDALLTIARQHGVADDESRNRDREAASSFFGYRFSTSDYLARRQRSEREQARRDLPDNLTGLQRSASQLVLQNPGATSRDIVSQLSERGGGQFKDLIGRAATGRGLSVTDFEKELVKYVESVQRARKAQDAFRDGESAVNRTLFAFGRLAGSLEIASAGLGTLHAVSTALQGVFAGQTGPVRVSGLNETVAGVGNPNFAEHRQALSAIAAPFGEAGKGIVEAGDAANRLESVLPGVLTRLAAGSPLKENENYGGQLRTGVKSALGYGENDRLPEQLERAVQAAVGRITDLKPDDVRKRAAGDVSGLSRELTKSYSGAIESAFRDIARQQTQAANAFIEGLVEATRRLAAVREAQNRLQEVTLQGTRFDAYLKAQQTGRFSQTLDFISLEQLQRPFQARQEALTGVQGAAANDVPFLSGRLGVLRDRLIPDAAREQQRQAFVNPVGQGFQNAAANLVKLQDEAARLQEALRHLSDASQRNAAAQEKLAHIEQDREGRLGFFERYATSGLEERQRLDRGVLLAQGANNLKTIRGFSPEDQSLIIQTLSSFGGAKLSGFAGQPVAADLKRQLLEDFGGPGATLDAKNRTERDELRNVVAENFRAAQAASQALVGHLQSANTGLVSGLQAAFNTFLERLGGTLARFNLSDRTVALGQAGGARESAEALFKQRGVLSAAGITTDADLSKALAGLEQVRSLTSAEKVLSEQRAVFAQGRTGFRGLPQAIRKSEVSPDSFFDQVKENFKVGGVDFLTGFLRGPGFEGLTDEQRKSVVNRTERNIVASPNALKSLRRGPAEDEDEIRGRYASTISSALRESFRQEFGSESTKYRGALDQRAGAVSRLRDLNLDPNAIIGQPDGGQAVLKALEQFKQQGLSFAGLDRKVQETTTTFNNLKEAVEAAQAAIRPQPRLVEREPLAERLASGGVAGMHPGSPSGPDTVPAWLTPGEYVINPQAARANRRLLDQVNAGRVVHLAAGGTLDDDISGLAAALRAAEEARKFRPDGRRRVAEEEDPAFFPGAGAGLEEVLADKARKDAAKKRVGDALAEGEKRKILVGRATPAIEGPRVDPVTAALRRQALALPGGASSQELTARAIQDLQARRRGRLGLDQPAPLVLSPEALKRDQAKRARLGQRESLELAAGLSGNYYQAQQAGVARVSRLANLGDPGAAFGVGRPGIEAQRGIAAAGLQAQLNIDQATQLANPFANEARKAGRAANVELQRLPIGAAVPAGVPGAAGGPEAVAAGAFAGRPGAPVVPAGGAGAAAPPAGGFDAAQFVQAMAAFNASSERLFQAFTLFDAKSGALAAAIEKIPASIKLETAGKLEVIHNGAEVFATLLPEFQRIATEKVEAALEAFRKERLPDA